MVELPNSYFMNLKGTSAGTTKVSRSLANSYTINMAPAQNGAGHEAATSSPLPHPGIIHVSKQYLSQSTIERLLTENGTSAKEANMRLEGVKMIEQVCKELQLPLKTYNAACTFYHEFRLKHKENEYTFQDASMACLMFACKVEDTIKKSKEILCTSWNLNHPSDVRTADDKMFEKPQQLIIGLERMIIETLCFDFRVRNPQKILVKITKDVLTRDEAKVVYPMAWQMSYDMYKTFAPIKQTAFVMALGLLELSARITNVGVDKFQALESEKKWHAPRQNILETMMDLLDLYTQYPKQAKVGGMYDVSKFIDIKIAINEEYEAAGYHVTDGTDESSVDYGTEATGLPDRLSGLSGNDHQPITQRFVFDRDAAEQEMETVAEYFDDEWEEIEVEVEETVDPTPAAPRDRPREHRGHGRRHGGHGHGGRHGHDAGWYGGGGGGSHRNDRRRRGGGFF